MKSDHINIALDLFLNPTYKITDNTDLHRKKKDKKCKSKIMEQFPEFSIFNLQSLIILSVCFRD